MWAVRRAVAAAFQEPEKYRNNVIPVYGEVLTCNQMVEIFTEVTGIKAKCDLGRLHVTLVT